MKYFDGKEIMETAWEIYRETDQHDGIFPVFGMCLEMAWEERGGDMRLLLSVARQKGVAIAGNLTRVEDLEAGLNGLTGETARHSVKAYRDDAGNLYFIRIEPGTSVKYIWIETPDGGSFTDLYNCPGRENYAAWRARQADAA